MKQNQIDLVRRFNRAVTKRIGALDDAYLSRGSHALPTPQL
jgi:hypothetical protein